RRTGHLSIQVHLRIEELLQRTYLRPLLGHVFFQPAGPNLCGHDCGVANRRRKTSWDAADDLCAASLASLVAAFEIPDRYLLHLSAGCFFYWPESVGGIVFRGLGRSATVSRSSQPCR